ncbi:MAG: hypothetical protein HOP17_12960 [Acidobacteria bacterium]|nr:hypothetical protein [Acidobacteriota bacterium]
MKDIREREGSTAETVVIGKDTRAMLKRFGVIGAVGLVLFLLGFVPRWLSARSTKNELASAQASLLQSDLQTNLASAALNARRGEYEQARQQASNVFTELRSEVESERSVFDIQQREALKPILTARDETITMLARNDPASAERLSDLYFTFLQVGN